MANDNETIEDVGCYLRNSCEVVDGSGSVLDGGELADRYLAAHNREIGELEGERNGLLKANWSLAYDNTRLREENAKLRALVNDLDIALTGSLDIIGNVCEYIQAACGTMLRVETYREILAKAREVCK